MAASTSETAITASESESSESEIHIGWHYDFIEVGTSDYSTITHYCAHDECKASCIGSEIWSNLDDLSWARGLAVDPVLDNLNALPDLPRVQKVEAAMDEYSGESQFYFVSQENITKYLGEYTSCFGQHDDSWSVDVMWYAGALGSLGKPHPNLEYMLESVGRLDLLDRKIVQVHNWGSLCKSFHVRTADVVQLDCEGKDCAILRSMLRHYDDDYDLPRVVAFEANHLTPHEEVDDTLRLLDDRGYRLRFQSNWNAIVERDWQ